MTEKQTWRRAEAKLLQDQGLNERQIAFVLVRLAENREQADLEGYGRGFNSGYKVRDALDKPLVGKNMA